MDAEPGLIAMLFRMFKDRGVPENMMVDTAHDQARFGPLARLADQFGFKLLAVTLAGPGTSCYDPLLIRTVGRAKLEQDERRQTQLFNFDLCADPFAKVSELNAQDLQPSPERVVALLNLVKGKAVSLKNLREMSALLNMLQIHRLMVFADKKPVGSSLSFSSIGLAVEFLPNPLLPIVDHVLVPRHRRLPASEAAALRKKIKGINAQLRSNDVVCAYYGFPVGCTVAIDTECEATGTLTE